MIHFHFMNIDIFRRTKSCIQQKKMLAAKADRVGRSKPVPQKNPNDVKIEWHLQRNFPDYTEQNHSKAFNLILRLM